MLVAAGRGNNGGDGFVAARHLQNEGYDVRVLLAGSPEGMRGDAAVNLEIVRRSGIPLEPIAEGAMPELAGDLIVDALLGTGVRGQARGVTAALVEAINASGVPVLAVDCKYKRLEPDEFRHHDLYQMLAYCTAMAIRRGMLIYPAHEMPVQGEVSVRHAHVRIQQATLDLSGDVNALRIACDQLVREVIVS